MRRPELIARQAAHPRGVLGRVIARIMALETATPNQRTLELLRIDEGCRVLEVGFGHGHTLARAAELAAKGFVTGIDISGTMVEMAQAFNRDSIAKGLIEVRQASSDQIPYPEESFDRIYAVHTLYFLARSARPPPGDSSRLPANIGSPHTHSRQSRAQDQPLHHLHQVRRPIQSVPAVDLRPFVRPAS